MSTTGFHPDTVDGRKLTEAEADRLHFLRNRPDPPMINGEPLTFPGPESHRPFPAAMYGPWTDQTKRAAMLTIAGRLALNLGKEHDYEEVLALLPAYDSRLIQSERERVDWAARGWADGPDLVEAAQTRMFEHVAEEAAVRAYDDQHMTARSQDEFHAADVAHGDDHLIDLPVPKRGPGRPRKDA